MRLNTLVRLQALFAVMALGFLFASAWYARSTGEPLGAAPVVPSALMFLVYGACLVLPRMKRLTAYRIATAVAFVPFGVGGVALNILNYLQNGLRDYSSFSVWCVTPFRSRRVALNTSGIALGMI